MHGKHQIIVFLLIGTAFLGCSDSVDEVSQGKDEIDTTPPEISSTTPVRGVAVTDYGVRAEISVDFSEAMNDSTLETSFTLDLILSQTERDSVSGSVRYSPDTYTATYVPDGSLIQGKQYLATVNTAATDTSGNNLPAQVEWRFETTMLPEVLSVYPPNLPAATAFPPDSPLTIEFSEAIDDGTLSTGDLALPATATVRISLATNGNIALALDNTSHAIFTPDKDLNMLTDYIVTIAGVDDASGGIKDLAGNAMAQSFLFSFKTGGVPWVGTKQLGVTDLMTFGTGVASDPGGNIFIAGYTNGGLDGNTPPAERGRSDAFVTKYAADGTKQWTQQLGVQGQGADTFAYGVATDAGGNAYVAGQTSGGLDGNTKATGDVDSFLAKYNAKGVLQWVEQLGVTSAKTYGHGVATDPGGNVFVTGYTEGSLDGQTGFRDFFLVKYNDNGVRQWIKQLGVASALTYGNGVATDPGGNVFVTGYTAGDLDGDEENTQTGVWDTFVIKYNANGIRQWIKQLGVTDKITFGQSVATDPGGNVFVTGLTAGDLDGNGGNTQTGGLDAFVIKYDTNGNRQWIKQFGVTGVDTDGRGIATSGGNVFVTGWTGGDLNANTNTGVLGFFVIKYTVADGTRQWIKQLGVASADTFGRGVTTDPGGNVFVAGDTFGGLDGNTLTGIQDFFVTKYDTDGLRQ